MLGGRPIHVLRVFGVVRMGHVIKNRWKQEDLSFFGKRFVCKVNRALHKVEKQTHELVSQSGSIGAWTSELKVQSAGIMD